MPSQTWCKTARSQPCYSLNLAVFSFQPKLEEKEDKGRIAGSRLPEYSQLRSRLQEYPRKQVLWDIPDNGVGYS
jgi:hypothetical protein